MISERLAHTCGVVQALLDETTAGNGPIEEVEAARRRHRAELLLDATSEPTAVLVGPSRAPRLVNAAWRELLGGDVGVLAGLPARAVASIDEVIRTGRRSQLEDVELQARGRLGYGTIVMEPLRGARGEIEGVIVACADVTDAAIAGRLGVVSPAAVWTGVAPDRNDCASTSWQAYTGVTDAAWLEAVDAHDRARCMAAVVEACRVHDDVELVVRVRSATGSCHRHRIRIACPAPGPRWFAAAIAEPDRDGAAGARAEDANHQKDQFLAQLSHELRGSLATMRLWAGLLRTHEVDGAIRERAIDAIHQSVLVQSRLVGDLLDMSRAIAGKLRIDRRDLDVADVVSDAVTAIAPSAQARRITVDVHLDPVLRFVVGDAIRLRQIFDNLLANALKFTDPDGRISVTSRRDGAALAVEIADNGRGIARELLPQLFDAFSQSDDELAANAGGLGLGLAIAFQLVALHGGTLEAASAGRGLGSTFMVRLPAATRRVSATSASAPGQASLAGLRVLVVDDDARLRNALALLLRRVGAEVESADSAAAARALVARSRFDAWVFDIGMPSEDGYALIRAFRSAGDATPALALTAHAADADAQRARAAGYDLHLGKPIDLEGLVAGIHHVIAARGAASPDP